VPALPSCILEPLWDQFAALLPQQRHDSHPLGCHRRRIPDWVIFDKLIRVLVFGCGYRRIDDATCSASTLRRRRDEWIALGLAERLHLQATRRWPVERTHAWGNQFGKLRWCTECNRPVVEFWLCLAHAIITLGRLIRQAWTHYRWEGRPRRRP
jgi:transposase